MEGGAECPCGVVTVQFHHRRLIRHSSAVHTGVEQLRDQLTELRIPRPDFAQCDGWLGSRSTVAMLQQLLHKLSYGELEPGTMLFESTCWQTCPTPSVFKPDSLSRANKHT